MFTAVIYVSNAAHTFDHSELQALADQSSEKNARLGVSGYLFYASEMFMQYIEGEQDATLELMATIRHDERHTVVVEIVDHALGERRFSGWDMRWLKRQDLQFLQMETVLVDYLRGRDFFRESHEWRASVWQLVDQLAQCHRDMKVKSGPINASNFEQAMG